MLSVGEMTRSWNLDRERHGKKDKASLTLKGQILLLGVRHWLCGVEISGQLVTVCYTAAGLAGGCRSLPAELFSAVI